MARRRPRVLPFPVGPELQRAPVPVSEPPQPELFSPENLLTPDNAVLRLTRVLIRATKIAPAMRWCPPVADRLFANIAWFELALDSLEAHLAECGEFDGLTRAPAEIRNLAQELWQRVKQSA